MCDWWWGVGRERGQACDPPHPLFALGNFLLFLYHIQGNQTGDRSGSQGCSAPLAPEIPDSSLGVFPDCLRLPLMEE